MTGGAVSMEMVHGMAEAVNGRLIHGLSRIIRGFFRNRKENRAYEKQLNGRERQT